MGDLGEAFIQAPEHRPNTHLINSGDLISPDEIPTIDLSFLGHPDHDKTAIAKEIAEACQRWGFFQVVNHGLPSDLRRRVDETMAEFFNLTTEEKRKVKRDEVNPMGYHDEEHTKNIRDWKEIFDYFLQDSTIAPATTEPEDTDLRKLTNQWPQNPSHGREICQEYAREVEKLAFKLLELISISLGLPGDRLAGFFNDQTSFVRFNHYPPCPNPELALGVGRHKDAGAITVLAQDSVGGLQVSRRSDGQWFPVTPNPDALIINIGNCIQVWTNDKYWSAEHRVVVNSSKERFSIPFFFFPSHEVNIEPLEELISEDNPPCYKMYNWGKFFVSRNRSDYKKLEVENIQIDHFKA
ncbi:PREDICTED: protein DMR6-LIKE OXYGENASE 2-like [Camelina sativa]|uniref:Protein DMR6-LIKE OXYGENASE 2-like n=1 Tax=Camelina sativa TaxID=90675 RepID=A0ABM1R1G3_CAMSA|nr:PREDICTED: protein DMR6-LIKE OXYGENASE 2-like [Camelina sativa]